MPTNPEIRNYQDTIQQMLRQVYPANVTITKEWSSKFGNRVYSPRVDVAVGPFATRHGERCTEEYNGLMRTTKGLINKFIDCHLANIQEAISPKTVYTKLCTKNWNARCFMAVEVENRGSRKHLMGDAVNAAVLGRIGMVVAWTPTMLKAFVNLRRYFNYLAQVDKNTFNVSNLLILDKDQLQAAIQEFSCATYSQGGKAP